MNRHLLSRAALATITTVTAFGLLASPAAAKPGPDPQPSRMAGDVAIARAIAECDPNGTASSDSTLATQLNGRLNAKMRGYMSAYRVSCARMVIKAVQDRGLHPRAAVIAIATTIVESSIDNISEELDHDSLGLFQQRASWGSVANRLNPIWATNAFLGKMLSKYPNDAWKTASVGEVCQAVQVSAYPDRYQPQAADAQIIVDTLWPVVATPPGADGGTTRFADLDGDGRDEIVAFFGDGTVHAYRNRGWDDPKVYDGPDQKVVASGFTDPSRAKFGDVDGDGRAELVSFFPDGTVHAYRNRGWSDATVYNGNDQKVVASGFTDPSTAKFGDLDGDNRDELVSFFGDGTVHAYRNRGWSDATVYNGNDQKVVASGFTDPARAKFGDVDGDGR
ncbi:FG-GAP repeat domain-containing protein, partial [Streptosporangium subroseum]